MQCAAALCGYDGIGRHARFRFLCREACGFKSHYPQDVICRYGYFGFYCGDFKMKNKKAMLCYTVAMMQELNRHIVA